MASQQELSRALHDRSFGVHHDPTSLRPGQPRGYANLVALLLDLRQILPYAKYKSPLKRDGKTGNVMADVS